MHSETKQSKYKYAVFFLFCSLHALLSLVNHYQFRTYALDLGLYTHALYQYAHLQLADCNLFKENFDYLLADHLDFYLPLFSPLVYVFGSYTLLLVQITAVLLGGVGVYRYITLKTGPDSRLPLWAMVYFYSYFGIFSAIAFDYHSNVVGAMLLPWFFYYIEKQRFGPSLALLLVALAAKENMGLWLAFVCMGLAVANRTNPARRKALALFSAICLLYFIIAVAFIMPLLSKNNVYEGFKYSALGANPSQAFWFILKQPWQSLKLLFVNHSAQATANYVKTETHLFILLSGLWLLFIRPWYVLMLLPLYFQKMWHDNPSMWGIGSQYSVEFAAIMAPAAFSIIAGFKHKKTGTVITAILILLSLGISIRTMDNTVAHTNKSAIRFYQAAHFQNDFNTAIARQQLQALPAEAALSAQSPFVPHLALRRHIYQFPIIKNAEYIVYTNYGSKFPLSDKDFKKITDSLLRCENWKISFADSNLTILRKRQ